MIAFLFLLLFTLALFHWAYESALAPSFRLGARYKLFALRDELRQFSRQHGVQLDRKAIAVLEGSINGAIEYMRSIDFAFVWAFRERCASDQSFRDRTEDRTSLVESYRDPEFQTLRYRYEKLFGKVMAINSGAWFVYLVPFFVIAFFWRTVRKTLVRLSLTAGDDFPELSGAPREVCAEPV
jgi:hypothetical protein